MFSSPNSLILCSWIVFGLPFISGFVYEHDPKELLNWCIDARHHKSHPGPADGLHQQCKPWEKRSCCTKETTVSTHNENMYGFNWDHCSHVKPLSDACRRHFVQDLCFYQCSPNTGPWVVKVNGSKIRNERFFNVPLCSSECTKWFTDCAEERTCTDNWVRNFDWSTGSNRCLLGTSCRTYREVFGTAEKFCETVWDHSWKVVPDTEPCMKMWFKGGDAGNPNDLVAQRHLNWLIQTHRLGDLASSIQDSSAGTHSMAFNMALLVFVPIMTILQFGAFASVGL